MAKDPVCGMEVKEGNVCSTYEGQKYCFCAQGCKDAFDKDPSQYMAKNGSAGQKHCCCG